MHLFQLSANGVAIDNMVVGTPEVQCGPSFIYITAQTDNNFAGYVYVKNHFGEAGCSKKGTGASFGDIELQFDACDGAVYRRRSV